jgi:tetratricopeptide (TPR) repeat protein
VKSISNAIVLVLGLALASVAPAYAGDNDPPSQADLDKAKKAFAEGKKLHEQKKLPEAIEKFKESYRLSKNPLLLYNIGLTMEEAGMEDLALMYYRRFLKEAPAESDKRPAVEASVKTIEKKLGLGSGPTNPTPDPGMKPNPNKEPKTPVVVKPPGTYKEDSFQHQVVDSAPPGKPLDVTASVPEDSGFVVTLYFRTAGEGKWTPKVMKWRYRELVARIPAPKMIGKAVQYYIEAKDSTGTSIAKSGKSTSPNQVLLEAGVAPRFYPDMTDDGDAKPVSQKDLAKSDTDDDPINKRKSTPKKDDDIVVNPTPSTPGNGFMDVGSSKFTKVKYTTTIVAGTALAFGVLSYVQALKYASALETDSAECGAPPCRKFNTSSPVDTYAQDVESTGKQWNTFFKLGAGLGIVTGAVAGYFWYKEMKAKKRGEMKVSKTPKKDETSSSWLVVPAIGENTAGAHATVRF